MKREWERLGLEENGRLVVMEALRMVVTSEGFVVVEALRVVMTGERFVAAENGSDEGGGFLIFFNSILSKKNVRVVACHRCHNHLTVETELKNEKVHK
ncbi:hypothetical protein ACH5RR_004967 [Cinchona calisaya]|uniref:Uncharacterized protein n=1 Tax=Cinchona calisaya TaxID=153742 RepID=A0ABD3AZ87_9GENT